ncbi:granulocyte colony-stimulating factor receptor [Thalassophryne amazonica]|uniref:granulocyte colony-stimulating factor receptor n=1 Tax=Thalassophryne amazonica TaxID=390379 RepID=UPI0014723913|nr:granulocyte colony-stimulating factor receptor [Thalassophryne amazonica]XP_034029955.1 granulocyte colony-stimulating factor receptor [Thalassophryne amazonica]
MIFTWESVIVMLVVLVSGVTNEDDIPLCGRVRVSRSVVVLGSPVMANCVIRDDCPLVRGRTVQIEWHLNDQHLPSKPSANYNGRNSTVIVQSFNETRAFLTCCVQNVSCQIVGGMEIRAGYPPEVPESLSCQTNLTSPSTLTCQWDPGKWESHLLTEYSLHTEMRKFNKHKSYAVPAGVHHYAIPRSDFSWYQEMKIYVKVVNELGEATSLPIIVEPLSVAKFDPPTILKVEVVPKKYGCLYLKWTLSQTWVLDSNFNMEVRLVPAESSPPILMRGCMKGRSVDQCEVCNLLHWTRYDAQIRVRYKQSPWSEWSTSQSGVTLEKAPTGQLDSWMKVSGDSMHKPFIVDLFWKPSKQFRTNGQNVSYIVSRQKQPGGKGQLCSTTESYCTFQLHPRVQNVFLSAVNAAGKSRPTEVRILFPQARTALSNVTVRPHDDKSMLVQWTSLASSDLSDYVVEWKPLLDEGLASLRFAVADRNQSGLLITGSFEPYKPYGISVYPRFKNGMGRPQTVNAYSSQKEPSIVPKLRITTSWQPHVELIWDEIQLEQRNGIIRNYKVFYWDKQDNIKVVDADLESRSVILTGLSPSSQYEAFLMVSTYGGSRNGSIIHFKFEPFDGVLVVMPVLLFIVLSLSICTVVIFKQKRIKVHCWAAVPDPANSSIKKWTSETCQDIHPVWDFQEPNPIYLSHLSFLELPNMPDKKKDDSWLHTSEDDTSDLGESILGSPFVPGYSGTNSDTVPYATVIFSGPGTSPTAQGPHYLRSDSTQPLLDTEETFSPHCYQNMTADGISSEQCFFGWYHNDEPQEEADMGVFWDDFPFLRALAMNESQTD